jgi:hypothetical protein
LLLGGLLAACTCTGPSITGNGGSGTRTGNPCTVAGVALDTLGNPVAGAVVRLRDAGYLTPLPVNRAAKVYWSEDPVTDQNGAFQVDSVDSGAYALEIDDLQGHARRCMFTVSGDDTLVDLGRDTIASVACVNGSVPVTMLRGHRWFVQVYGMERLSVVDSLTGQFTIDELPRGTYTLRLVAVDAPRSGQDIGNVTIAAADTVTLPPSSIWQHHRKLQLNTTTSGADVAADVVYFPVLIRLRSANFDFNQARRGGADLLFTKPDGAILPYEVERWDSAAGQAEIWVKVDTVYGNNALQSIDMHWGNPLADTSSAGAVVFDTADGFEAVLHLGSTCDDATYWKNGGSNYGTSESEGLIGGSRYFSGSDSIKIPGLLNTPASVSLSAWARLDSVEACGAELISMGDDVVIRLDDTSSAWGTKGSFRYDSAYYNWSALNTGRFLARTGWHLLTYTLDGSGSLQSLYIDGVLTKTGSQKGPIYYHAGRNTFIGTHAFAWGESLGKFDFIGCIDEVRISRGVYSGDWIKLCYMNQKETDALVIFK